MSGTAQLCVQGTWRWTQEGFAMLLKNSIHLEIQCFFLKSSNCQRGCYLTIFADDPDKRESHEVHSNIRGKRCNFQTASGVISKRSGNCPLVSHTVEICLPIFRVIPQFLYMLVKNILHVGGL